MDPYTSHGQDGIINGDGYVINDETVDALCLQALVCARAGADVIAPSDMMDGRVAAIRQQLDNQGFINTQIWGTSEERGIVKVIWNASGKAVPFNRIPAISSCRRRNG